MKRRHSVGFVFVSMITLAAIVGCREKTPQHLSHVTIARTFNPAVVPFFVLEDIESGDRPGIAVDTKEFTAGRLAFDAVLSGRADFGTVAETPLANAALEGTSFKIVATFASSLSHVRCLSRRDKGVDSPQKFRGKKIAVALGTVQEFDLHVLLAANGVRVSDVTIVNLQPPDMVIPFVNGDVDVACDWEPFLWAMEQKVGADAASFSTNSYFTLNLVTVPGYLEAHAAETLDLLRELKRSSDYIRDNPAAAQAIAARRLNLPLEAVRRFWPIYDFKIVLDDRLLPSINEEARWSIVSEHHADLGKPLNLRSLVADSFLKQVAPDNVHLSQ